MTASLLVSNPPPFLVGDVITFEYPKSNQLNNKQPHYSTRTIAVREIRDVGQTGLSPITITKRPILNRGRWLVTGICLEYRAERSFYFESMKDFKTTTWFTLGLFDPIDPDSEPAIIRGVFAPTSIDRRFMSKVIKIYQQKTEKTEAWNSIAAFPIKHE